MARAPSSVSFHAKGDESGERRAVGLTTRSRIPLRDSAGLEPDFPLRVSNETPAPKNTMDGKAGQAQRVRAGVGCTDRIAYRHAMKVAATIVRRGQGSRLPLSNQGITGITPAPL